MNILQASLQIFLSFIRYAWQICLPDFINYISSRLESPVFCKAIDEDDKILINASFYFYFVGIIFRSLLSRSCFFRQWFILASIVN